MKSWFIFAILLLSAAGSVSAQQLTPNAELRQSRDNLIQATNDHKETSQTLITLQEEELNQAAAKLVQLRELFAEGLIAWLELEESEKSLKELESKLAATRQQVVDADQLIAEVKASEEFARHQAVAAKKATNTLVRPVLMRYNGSTSWTVANLSAVQSFFISKFGRSLPLSTIGQSATHNRMGWDHRHAADVGLHPDSVEGRALIAYLQSQGIPYLAFRGAVPGVSTGPHIHIGAPSHRLA